LCRFCKSKVESPEHALLECTCVSSLELTNLRDTFRAKLFCNSPKLQNLHQRLTSENFLKAVIYSQPNIALVAKSAYDVLEIFYAVPVIRP
ncbi:hypothetical protein R3P38DRAFT_2377355, partial [Favolaschia claudopus]